MLFLLVVVATPAAGQAPAWRNLATFYVDNTEFFTPYRVGETILGAQFQSWLEVAPTPGPGFWPVSSPITGTVPTSSWIR